MATMEHKICAVCGAPYVGGRCPNCGSDNVETDDESCDACSRCQECDGVAKDDGTCPFV